MCSPRRLVEGSGRKGLAVVAQCAPSASFAHSRLPASRAGAFGPGADAYQRPLIGGETSACALPKVLAQRRASVAIRTARPARTVPMNQRCICPHLGLDPKKAATLPAMTTIRELTATLIVICVAHSTNDWASTFPRSG